VKAGVIVLIIPRQASILQQQEANVGIARSSSAGLGRVTWQVFEWLPAADRLTEKPGQLLKSPEREKVTPRSR
jgi:hypothetical protein